MVNYSSNYQINKIFEALADETRRDILLRVLAQEMNISQIAIEYDMSMPAISKHIKILDSAGLVWKVRNGKERIVKYAGGSLDEASEFLATFSSGF